MNWADFIILGIIGVSVLIGVWRGFIREALSLLAWVLAVWAALMFHGTVEQWLQPYIETPILRLAVAVLLLFFIILLLASLISLVVNKLLAKAGLSAADRIVGILFGVLRGALLVTVLILLGGLTNAPADDWWRQSMFIHYFQDLAIWARGWLPEDLAANIHY